MKGDWANADVGFMVMVSLILIVIVCVFPFPFWEKTKKDPETLFFWGILSVGSLLMNGGDLPAVEEGQGSGEVHLAPTSEPEPPREEGELFGDLEPLPEAAYLEERTPAGPLSDPEGGSASEAPRSSLPDEGERGEESPPLWEDRRREPSPTTGPLWEGDPAVLVEVPSSPEETPTTGPLWNPADGGEPSSSGVARGAPSSSSTRPTLPRISKENLNRFEDLDKQRWEKYFANLKKSNKKARK